MRLLIRLEATRDAAYSLSYHHKLRGVIWNGLSDTEYATFHGDSNRVSFCFSNPYPGGYISEGDQRYVLIASPHNGMIEQFDDVFTEGDEFNIGEMPFVVSEAHPVHTDVGEPGSEGTLQTETGVYVPLPEERWDEYNISPEYNASRISWTPEDHPLGLFLERVNENLSWKHSSVFPQYMNSPSDDAQLFESIRPQKTYPITIPVTSNSGYEYTFINTKWEFDYRVRDDDHRRWLNLLLDAGTGWRNSMGFGFTNIVDN